MRDELLRLMINFQLCYKIPGEDESFIAPQLRNDNQPVYQWDETKNLILRYTYEFMPKGILTRFIVVMHQYIASQDLVWRSGVTLNKDATLAEIVEDYDKREIKIRVVGKQKKSLLTIITYELDKIHARYKKLRYSKLIPCNCVTCKDNQSPHFYSAHVLQDFATHGQSQIQCRKPPFQMVSVLQLIDDVVEREMLVNKDEDNDFTFNAPIQNVFIQSRGVINMTKLKNRYKSSWANGSFYLFATVIIIGGLGFLAGSLPFFTLALIIIAGILIVPLVGAFQLRQDDRLSEKNFMELITIVIGQLPLIGRLGQQLLKD